MSLDWRWDVDESTGLAAFEIATSLDHESLGAMMATDIANSFDLQGIETVTNMLRTRRMPGLVTVLWTGETSDIPRTRQVFEAYGRVVSAHALE